MQLMYPLISALYLENYNPNIEYHSLVLRPGLDMLYNYNKNFILNTSGNVYGKDLSGHNNYENTKHLMVQHYARLNYVDAETDFNVLDAIFSSYRMRQDILPSYHQDNNGVPLFITTLRYHAVNPKFNNEEWLNSYEKNTLTDVESQFLSLGKFRDVVRYGSSFLYVTEPIDKFIKNDDNKVISKKRLYFPVYTFVQNPDPKKKFLKALSDNTYDFLNGLDTNDLDDDFWDSIYLRKFNVKVPSAAFLNNPEILDVSIQNIKTNIPDVSLWKDYNYRNLNLTIDIDSPTGPNQSFKYDYGWKHEHSKIYGSTLASTRINRVLTYQRFNDTLTAKPKIELLFWEQPLLWLGFDKVAMTEIEDDTNDDFTRINILAGKTDSIYGSPQTEPESKFAKICGYSYSNHFQRGTWSLRSSVHSQYRSEAWKETSGSIVNRFYKFAYIESMFKPNSPVHNRYFNNVTDWKDEVITINNQSYKYWGVAKANVGNGILGPVGKLTTDLGAFFGSSAAKRMKFWSDFVERNKGKEINVASRNVIHDYISVELPRCWLSGDKIPLLLTTTLNGKETILLKDVFEISKDTSNDFVVGRSVINNNNPTLLSHNKSDFEDNDLFGRYLKYTTTGNVNFINSVMLANYNGLIEGKRLIAPTESLTLVAPYRDNKIGQNTITPNNDYTSDLSGWHNTIQFTIRLNKEALTLLLSNGATNIKLYASRPDNTKKLFDKIGTLSITDCPPIYLKPLINDNSDDKIIEGNKYGLVKTFLLEGKSDIIEDYTNVKRSNYAINSWALEDDWIYAVPLSENNLQTMHQNSSGIRTFNSKLPKLQFSGFTKNDIQRETLDENGDVITTIDPSYKYLYNYTPDFFLWDYPQDSPSFLLSNSGQYYEGTGARCITSIKGRTFIGGCYDKDYNEEQGIVRYSSMNAGVHIPDLFVDEEKIQIGHLPITALMEYREQLWVFNKDNYYRVALNEISNPVTWEFLDSKFGQGTFSPKTLTKTPYGVCFCAFGGIYLSDGTNPINLVDNPEQMLSVKSLYQYLLLGNTNEYAQINKIGNIHLEKNQNYNIFVELFYDSINDELVLTTPIEKEVDGIEFDLNDFYDPTNDEELFNNSKIPNNHFSNTHWIKLVYSFANKNWRVESGMLHNGVEAFGTSVTYAENGRMWENDRVLRNHIGLQNDMLEATNLVSLYTIYSFNFNLNKDILYGSIGNFYKYIIGKLITHNIGNGEQDNILSKVILECTPKETNDLWYGFVDNPIQKLNWLNANYTDTKDPYLTYELRTRTFNNQTQKFVDKDLVELNMNAKGGLNPFQSIMQTPINNNLNYDMSSEETMVGRESLNLIAPMDKFRRTKFTLISKLIVKIRSLSVIYKEFTRRNF
jgi:hypothetical protein